MIRRSGIGGLLGNLDKVKREALADRSLDPQVALLRSWQSQRLAATYRDLLDSPRYRPACLFFLDDIYAARDFSQRDHDIERVYTFARRFVPDSMLQPVALTVQLHHLTEDLDHQLLDALINHLNVTDTLTPELYAEGYRRCDNYVERVRQIDLIVEISERLDGVVRSPLTGPMLSLAARPMRSAGYDELIGFLERGYHGFKRMHGSDHFRTTIKQREIAILERIYAHDPDPLGIELTPVPEED